MICLIVLNYKDFETTFSFINRVKEYKSIDKIIVVDNNSEDGSFERLSILKNSKIHVIKSSKNGGYGYGNNIGIKYAMKNFDPEFFIISNPDVEFENNIIHKMVDIYKSREKIGIVSPRIIENNKKAIAAWKLPRLSDDIFQAFYLSNRIFKKRCLYTKEEISHYKNIVDVVPGCFFCISKKAIEEINFFDEDVFLYCEERILSYKLKKKKYKTYLINNIEYLHNHSTSINKSINSKVNQYKILYSSRMIYYKKYLNLNNFQLLLLKIIYGFAIFEKKIIYKIKGIKL